MFLQEKSFLRFARHCLKSRGIHLEEVRTGRDSVGLISPMRIPRNFEVISAHPTLSRKVLTRSKNEIFFAPASYTSETSALALTTKLGALWGQELTPLTRHRTKPRRSLGAWRGDWPQPSRWFPNRHRRLSHTLSSGFTELMFIM